MSVIKRRVTGTVYVDKFGDDIRGNGNSSLPYQTLDKVPANATLISISAGFYLDKTNKLITAGNKFIIADGSVKVVIPNSVSANSGWNVQLTDFNLEIQGSFNSPIARIGFLNCVVKATNISLSQSGVGVGPLTTNQNNTLFITDAFSIGSNNSQYNTLNQTLIVNSITMLNANFNNIFSIQDCILSSKNSITLQLLIQATGIRNCIIRNTGTFKIATQPTRDLTTTTIQQLRLDAVAAFGGTIDQYFIGCVIADPLFTDELAEDYTLQPNSPALYMSTTGSYVGKYGVGVKLYCNADNDLTSLNNSFIESTKQNISLNQLSPNKREHYFGIEQFDSLVTSKIESKVFYSHNLYELKQPILKSIEDNLNSEVDWNSRLANTPTLSGAIALNNAYKVLQDTVTYNGVVYPPDSYFIGVTGVTTFTGNGKVYEVFEAPNRKSIGIRISKGRGRKLVGETLKPNTWYVGYMSSVVYDGITYPQNIAFKTNGVLLTHTGGNVVELFEDSEPYQPLEFMYDARGIVDADGKLIVGNGSQQANYLTDPKINIRAFQIELKIQRENITT